VVIEMETAAFWPYESWTVTVHVPTALGVTPNVTLAPLVPPVAATVARPEQVSVSVMVPV
jgi:hypothetical protein